MLTYADVCDAAGMSKHQFATLERKFYVMLEGEQVMPHTSAYVSIRRIRLHTSAYVCKFYVMLEGEQVMPNSC